MLYRCSFCGADEDSAWRCSDCGMIVCDSCSKGGKSGLTGKLARVYFGVASAGLTEVARAGYRKKKQKCPRCDGKSLIRI